MRLARAHDALLISDDVYDFLQWPVASSSATATTSASPSHHHPDAAQPAAPTPVPLPPLLPLLSQLDIALGPSPHDPPGACGSFFGHAVSNGSFSKLVGPGIRTGWVHGAAGLVRGFSLTGSNRSGGAASQFAAAVVHQLMRAGELETHLAARARPALRRRHALAVRAVREELGLLGVTLCGGGEEEEEDEEERGGVFGGYFVWLTLPEGAGLDAEEVAARAREEENLIIAPGRLFEVSGDEAAARFPRNIRLCFSWEDEEDVVEGVRRLGRVLRRMCEGTGTGQTPRGKGVGDVGDLK